MDKEKLEMLKEIANMIGEFTRSQVKNENLIIFMNETESKLNGIVEQLQLLLRDEDISEDDKDCFFAATSSLAHSFSDKIIDLTINKK